MNQNQTESNLFTPAWLPIGMPQEKYSFPLVESRRERNLARREMLPFWIVSKRQSGIIWSELGAGIQRQDSSDTPESYLSGLVIFYHMQNPYEMD